MTETQAQDIEIYVSKLARDEAESWLTGQFESLVPEKKKKGMPKTASLYRATWQNQSFPIIVFEHAAPGYTSLWFDHSELPWADDRECALVAAKHFQRNVRITAGGWENGADPDAWVEIDADGIEKEITWKG